MYASNAFADGNAILPCAGIDSAPPPVLRQSPPQKGTSFEPVIIRTGPVKGLCMGTLPMVKSSPMATGFLFCSAKARILGSKYGGVKKRNSFATAFELTR